MTAPQQKTPKKVRPGSVSSVASSPEAVEAAGPSPHTISTAQNANMWVEYFDKLKVVKECFEDSISKAPMEVKEPASFKKDGSPKAGGGRQEPYDADRVKLAPEGTGEAIFGASFWWFDDDKLPEDMECPIRRGSVDEYKRDHVCKGGAVALHNGFMCSTVADENELMGLDSLVGKLRLRGSAEVRIAYIETAYELIKNGKMTAAVKKKWTVLFRSICCKIKKCAPGKARYFAMDQRREAASTANATVRLPTQQIIEYASHRQHLQKTCGGPVTPAIVCNDLNQNCEIGGSSLEESNADAKNDETVLKDSLQVWDRALSIPAVLDVAISDLNWRGKNDIFNAISKHIFILQAAKTNENIEWLYLSLWHRFRGGMANISGRDMKQSKGPLHVHLFQKSLLSHMTETWLPTVNLLVEEVILIKSLVENHSAHNKALENPQWRQKVGPGGAAAFESISQLRFSDLHSKEILAGAKTDRTPQDLLDSSLKPAVTSTEEAIAAEQASKLEMEKDKEAQKKALEELQKRVNKHRNNNADDEMVVQDDDVDADSTADFDEMILTLKKFGFEDCLPKHLNTLDV